VLVSAGKPCWAAAASGRHSSTSDSRPRQRRAAAGEESDLITAIAFFDSLFQPRREIAGVGVGAACCRRVFLTWHGGQCVDAAGSDADHNPLIGDFDHHDPFA